MKVQAKTRRLPISARKLRLSADLVRGMRVVEAQQLLLATNKKSAVMVFDTLKSACANAENNYNLNAKELKIDEIRVDEGATLKRMRPRAKGASSAILHRSAHLTVIVADNPVPTTESKQTKPATRTASEPVNKEAK